MGERERDFMFMTKSTAWFGIIDPSNKRVLTSFIPSTLTSLSLPLTLTLDRSLFFSSPSLILKEPHPPATSPLLNDHTKNLSSHLTLTISYLLRLHPSQ